MRRFIGGPLIAIAVGAAAVGAVSAQAAATVASCPTGPINFGATKKPVSIKITGAPARVTVALVRGGHVGTEKVSRCELAQAVAWNAPLVTYRSGGFIEGNRRDPFQGGVWHATHRGANWRVTQVNVHGPNWANDKTPYTGMVVTFTWKTIPCYGGQNYCSEPPA